MSSAQSARVSGSRNDAHVRLWPCLPGFLGSFRSLSSPSQPLPAPHSHHYRHLQSQRHACAPCSPPPAPPRAGQYVMDLTHNNAPPTLIVPPRYHRRPIVY